MSHAQRAIVLSGVAIGLAASPVPAQHLADPPPITPDLALLAAQEAYTHAPVADVVQLRLASARSWMTVRIAPRDRTDLSDAVMLLELGDLRLHIDGKQLTAVSTRAPDVYFQTEISAPSQEELQQILPPIPVPQLALAHGWRDGDDLTPYTTDVHWATAAWDDAAGLVRLEGTAAEGPVTLELDQDSGRIARLLAETEAGRFELTASPTDPGNIADWAIDTSTRERVERVSELKERARPLNVGDQLPDVAVLDGNGEVRSPSALFRVGPPEWVEAPAARLVLILAPLRERQDAAADPEPFVRATLAGVDILTDEADEAVDRFHPFAAHLVIFAEAGGFEREAVDAAAAAWGVPAERVLWSPMEMPRLTGTEPGRAAAVVIDANRRLLAVLTEAADEGDVAGRLRRVLQRSAPE